MKKIKPQALQFIKLRLNNFSYAEIGRLYNMSRQNIQDVVARNRKRLDTLEICKLIMFDSTINLHPKAYLKAEKFATDYKTTISKLLEKMIDNFTKEI